MNKIQKKLIHLIQTLLNFMTNFLNQNNLKAKRQDKKG